MTSQADQVPLLDRQGEAHEEQPDGRFAIDDEIGAYNEHGESSRPLEGASASPEAYKYPPNAQPPSYREATGKSAISVHVSQLCSSVSSPDFSFVRQGLSQAWIFICRFWPTSRFAQVGLFMAGLWLLVILSGPVFDDAGPHAGAGYPWAGIDQLSEHGPGPISGDGHILTYANWTLRSCQTSNEHHREVLCISTTRIELDIPEGFHSTEGIFLYADPPRHNHLTDGRGHVPGTVEIKMVEEGSGLGQSPKGKAQVIIDAEYEQSRGEVFERSTIAKMASGLVSQGVGIYTYPLPPHYAKRTPPPLIMHIKILIPSGSIIPALKVQASGLSVGVFAEPDGKYADKRRSLRSASAAPIHQKRAAVQQRALSAPQFGRFIVQTATTPVRFGSHVPISAIGNIKATTYNGDIVVEGELSAAEIRLETMTGSVRIEENSHVTAWRESRVISQNGNIELKRSSWFYSSELLARTDNGNILGGGKAAPLGSGVWKTNKTLEMKTSNGAIHASYEVHMPTDILLNPSKGIRVETESKNGIVDVAFVGQEEGTKLHAKVTTSVGSAIAHMHKAFIGKWQLEGSRGNSKVTPPSAGDPREFHRGDRKQGTTKVREDGTIGRQDDDAAKDSNVFVHSSLGSAELSFA